MSIIDSSIWLVYLLLISLVSFQQGLYNTPEWLKLSAAFYLLACIHLVSAYFGGRTNIRGIRAARTVLVLFIASLVLLIVQILLPLSSPGQALLHQSDYGLSQMPNWFEPRVVWSIVPTQTQWLLLSELLMLTVFTLSISLVCTRRRVYHLLYVLVAVGLIHSVFGIIANYGGVLLVDRAQVDGHFSVARGWFVNRNHFASFISLCLMGTLSLQLRFLINNRNSTFLIVIKDQLLTRKAIIHVAMFISLCAVILSQSRAGFFGLVFASVLSILSLGHAGRQFGNPKKLLIMSVFVVSIALFYVGGDLLSRLSNESSLLGERMAQWTITWQAIKQSWLLGYGGNSYATVFQMVRDYGEFRTVIFNQAHNDFLHIWLEQGLVGLLLWISAMVLVVKHALDSCKSAKSSLVTGVMLASMIAILAALLQSGVDFNLQILNIRLYFFVIMAVVFALPTIKQRKGRPSSKIQI